jgi:hypothetical protein
MRSAATSGSFVRDRRDHKTCSPGSCSGAFKLQLFARYGSVAGRVTLEDGTPVVHAHVTASDPANVLSPVSVTTDDDRYYSFTRTQGPIETYGAIMLSPIPIPASNNWGLRVERQDWLVPGPGTKDWIISVGQVSKLVTVESSQLASADFRVTCEA